MKYSVELNIDKSIDELIALFDSAENLHKWMDGLESMEHMTGTPGEVGAKSKMTFLMGKRSIDMVETITEKNLPEAFTASYEMPGVLNIIQNHFEAIDDHTTRYVSEQEFQIKGFGMMKIMSLIMPGAFKKESMKNLKRFKAFAEGQS